MAASYLLDKLADTLSGNKKNVETLDPPEGSYFPQAPKIRADDFTMIRIALAISFSNTH